MGSFGEPEAQQRKPHTDEDDFAVADLAPGGHHHQFAPRVGCDHGAKLAAAARRRSRTRNRSVAFPICCR